MLINLSSKMTFNLDFPFLINIWKCENSRKRSNRANRLNDQDTCKIGRTHSAQVFPNVFLIHLFNCYVLFHKYPFLTEKKNFNAWKNETQHLGRKFPFKSNLDVMLSFIVLTSSCSDFKVLSLRVRLFVMGMFQY